MKVLNLYAGIGGNRKLWPENIEVTAIEKEREIASIYSDYFPADKVIVTDAHEYLLKNYMKYDFVWSSPPCPTHSDIRRMASQVGSYDPVYPDMELYQEIIFLKHFCKSKWVIENVISYYDPLIKPYMLGRHYFWSNFIIPKASFNHNVIIKNVSSSDKVFGFDISKYKTEKRKDQILRNCVNPELGKYIYDCAFKDKQQRLI